MLFIRAGRNWWVSNKLGEERGGLIAEVGETDYPPVKGWKFVKNGLWSSEDKTLECSRQPLDACKVITVTLRGKAKEIQPSCAGRYLSVKGRYNRGRQVRSFGEGG